jgi:hypothetical protein
MINTSDYILDRLTEEQIQIESRDGFAEDSTNKKYNTKKNS